MSIRFKLLSKLENVVGECSCTERKLIQVKMCLSLIFRHLELKENCSGRNDLLTFYFLEINMKLMLD